MLLSSKILLSIGTFGGGCAGILLFFRQWQKNNLNNLSNSSTLISESLTTQGQASTSYSREVLKVEKGNCKVIKASDDIVNFLWGWKTGEWIEDYFTVSCENTDIEDSKEKISKDWTGLFPTDLLVKNRNLTEGSKFDLKTYTEKTNLGGSMTTFSGERFVGNSVTGEWGEKAKTEAGKSVTVINSKANSKSIYLII